MKLLPLKLRFPRFPIAVEFTREGLVFVLLSLAIGAAAVNTGNNVLYLIFSIMLGLITVSGMISRRILRHLTPSLHLPDQMFAGTPHTCYISISNRKKKLPSVGIRFLLRQGISTEVGRRFFYVAAGQKVGGFADIQFPNRGIFTIREYELQTRFPFSFFLKIHRYFVEQTVRVYPKVFRLTEEVMGKFSDGLWKDSPHRGDSHQLLHLRDYSPLDSSKRIHWKASAKLEKLLVKEYQREHGRDLHLYFDCYAGPDQKKVFEDAISLIASLANLFLEKGIQGRIVFPDKQFRLGSHAFSLIPLLDYLAAMKTGEIPERKPFMPETPGTLVILLRSRKVPSSVDLQWPRMQHIYMEDWTVSNRKSVVPSDISAVGVNS